MNKSFSKRLLISFIIIIIIFPLASAQEENLYQQDKLKMELEVNGQFQLISENSGSSIGKVTAELSLFPVDDFRQTLAEIDTNGEVGSDKITFVWNDGNINTKKFGYTAIVQTDNHRKEVNSKISFPLTSITGYTQYLQPTESIDSNNPKIILQATELAEGEDDLFKVAFKLASWVEENINYDLNTLTADSTQKASWVLDNKEGVCDEMAALFIAMCRSLGIPARFVSGISYSTSDLFDKPWQPHGWAEVYFPDLGWVAFDITFGEYGYIDVTHIKLSDSIDPNNPDNLYTWLGTDVKLEAQPLQTDVKIIQEGDFFPEEISLEQDILSKEIGFGSYNLIKGILKNNANYYVATALKLAVPKEIEIVGRDRRNILLAPKEVKETFWVIKTSNLLDDKYWFTFPIIIYSEKNVSVKDSFTARSGGAYYNQNDIDKLTVIDEEKTYSRKITFNCDYKEEIKLGDQMSVSCTIKNSGNSNLQNLYFCLDNVCEIITLPINQEKSNQIIVEGNEAGWQKLIVSAENDLVEKHDSLEYAVLDEPKIDFFPKAPEEAKYGENLIINTDLLRDSFNAPLNVVFKIKGPGFENKWEMEQLNNKETISLTLDNPRLSWKNNFLFTASWEDQERKQYSLQKELIINAKGNGIVENVKMLFNKFFSLG